MAKAVKAADKDFNFATYDINNDGVVTNEELTIIIVHLWRLRIMAMALVDTMK